MVNACQGVKPAETAAAPQTMPKGTMLMSIGAKARQPAKNSARALGSCGIGGIYE
jgi:hypothetical protein